MKRFLLSGIILILCWQFAAIVADLPFLPPPGPVFLEMILRFRQGLLGPHLAVSLYRVLAALVGAFFPALFLGIGAGRNRSFDRVVSPAVYLLFPIPKAALLPIILLFLGLGNGSKIFFVALIVFFQFFLNIRDETAGISGLYYDSLTSLGGKKRDELRHIILPAILPRIFSSLRMSLGTAIAVLFLAETFATRRGIGWYIMDAWSRISYTEMYAGILALSLSGLFLFLLVDAAERFSCRWK